MPTQKHIFQKIESGFDNIEKYLNNTLPHGSGIDCKWEFDYLKNGKVKANNSYHCMNEHGYYDGFADFTLIFDPLKSLRAFKLQFNGKRAQNKNKQYMLRDYLEQCVYDILDDDKSIYQIAIAQI